MSKERGGDLKYKVVPGKSPERGNVQRNAAGQRKGLSGPAAIPLVKKETPKKAKEKKEKKKESFKFPSGLRLEISKDKEAAAEWKDDSSTPLECLGKKFPDKESKDIDKPCMDWVLKQYVNRVPIVKITQGDLDKNISKYFKVRDLVKIDKTDKVFMDRHGTWEKHKKFMIYDKDGEYYWNVARIDPNLCRVLDDIRSRTGFPLKIDEGVRPYAYNKDMYMAKFGKVKETSPHISGKAVDLERPIVDLEEIYAKLEKDFAEKKSKLRIKDPKKYEEIRGKLYPLLKKDLYAKDAKLVRAISGALAGKGGGWGYGDTVYHVDVKIQNGAKKQEGSWILDKKTGKAKLRMRSWPY